MRHPRLTTLLLTTIALAAGSALADPPGSASGTPRAAQKDAKDNRAERRREHRVTLFQNWGRFLDRAEVLAELRNRAERTARLRRMRFVAETERQGPAQEK